MPLSIGQDIAASSTSPPSLVKPSIDGMLLLQGDTPTTNQLQTIGVPSSALTDDQQKIQTGGDDERSGTRQGEMVIQ